MRSGPSQNFSLRIVTGIAFEKLRFSRDRFTAIKTTCVESPWRISAVQTKFLKFSESVTTTPIAAPLLADSRTPRSCNSALSDCSTRAASSDCKDEILRISQDTFSRAGRTAAIFRASSFAESSRVEERTPLGIPIKTKRNRTARQERVDRSAPIIGVLRLASRNTKKNSARWPGLQGI